MSGLDSVFAPSSVALVGASADTRKWGQWLMPGLVRTRDRRPLTLVNRSGRPLDGIPTLTSLRDADAAPELVVVCVPPAEVAAALDDAVAVGARAAIVITAGIDAVLGEGEEARIIAKATAAGLRVVGPNCLGMYDAAADLQVVWGDVLPGSLAVVSQSGQVGLECVTAAGACGLGISRFVSLGNQRDVNAVDVLRDLTGRVETKVVALYLETFGDGRALIDAVQRLADAGQPTVLLTVGASPASAAAARSHTGSMTSASDVIDAACRAAGAVRVSSPWELVDVAAQLATPMRARGRRIAVVGDSGGQGGVAADLVHAGGLVVPPFGEATQATLAAALPYTAAVGNPIDLGGGGTLDLGNYATIVEVAARSGEVDTVLLTGYFGAYCLDDIGGVDELRAAARMIDVAQTTGVPVVIHSQAATSPTLAALRAGGIAAYPSIDRAARAAALGAQAALAVPRRLDALGSGGPVGGSGYWAAREALSGYGVAFPAASRVGDADSVRAAAEALTMPVALKAGWLAHKSEAGGVALGLTSPDAAVAAFMAMRERLGDGEYVVEEMDTRSGCVEMLIGVRRDGAFGPLVVVAAGGTEAEVLADSTIELAPLDEATSLEMLRRLRCWPLLDGFRGRPVLDVSALVRTIVAVGRWAADHPDHEELEINPVRVGTRGALAVDALM